MCAKSPAMLITQQSLRGNRYEMTLFMYNYVCFLYVTKITFPKVYLTIGKRFYNTEKYIYRHKVKQQV